MKKLPIKYWEIDSKIDCLLFYAQRTAEILFDYTLDTYKYPALYSTSIIEEAIFILTKIESNEMSEKSLEPIIEELKWKVSNDKIVKIIVGDGLEDYLKFDFSNSADLKSKLEILYNRIKPKTYIKKSIEVLTSLIIENKQKKQINKIAPNLISALIDYGYSQNYLHFQTLRYFFYRIDGVEKISRPEQIKEFFELFSLEFNKYNVCFKGSAIFNDISTSCENFDIEISEIITPKSKSNSESFFINKKRDGEIFITCKEIRALDPQSAKLKAEERINVLAKLFTYFQHKKQPKWSKQALIYDSKDSSFIMKLSAETSPMLKCVDFYPTKAAEKLNSFIKNFGIESQSFYRFDRAVELHGISLNSRYSDNQLLQNWIAFETLLVGYSKDSKIEQVLFALVPALKLSYLSRIVENFLDDILRWDKEKSIEYLNEINIGNNLLEKTAALLSILENKPIREKFYSSLHDFPLLKFRLSSLQELFSSPEKLYEYYKFHENKVTWQIKRIYRTRNLIVHNGFVPDFNDVLIENSHTYLDLFINQIIEYVLDDSIISTISHGIKEIQLKQKRHENYIKNQFNCEINELNYKYLMFN